MTLWRRSAVAVAVVTSAAIGVYLARGYPGGPAVLPVPLAMLALGFVATRRVAWLGVIGLLAVTTVGSAIGGSGIFFHLLIVVGWGAASVLAGQALASRGERAAAERERLTLAHEQALVNERLRIAQDVHDSVAHAMATINVQSGVAAHLVEHRPEQAAVALEAIRTASRDALEELGSILGVLREADSSAPTLPLAGLVDVPSLVERARTDGVTVTLDQSGDVGAVTNTVSTAAYRVVPGGAHQHAPPRRLRCRRHGHDRCLRPWFPVRHGPRRRSEHRRRPGRAGRSTVGRLRAGRHERARQRQRRVAVNRADSDGIPGRRRVARSGEPLIRVVLADDQVLVRTGFRALLDAESDIEVVGEANDGAEAVGLADQQRPDVVLMDIRMPNVDVLTAARQITANDDLGDVRVLVLTTFELDEYVYEALDAGASGFLVKHTEPAELIRAVRVVAAGDALLSPSVTRRLIARLHQRPHGRREARRRHRLVAHRARTTSGRAGG